MSTLELKLWDEGNIHYAADLAAVWVLKTA